MTDLYDLAVIGGGINGCGIARDAAGRGLKVHLAEAGDLGGATSAWSTKLIHGGLRYLEHAAFRLVREALVEREVLWRSAPHLIRPIRFVLPHRKGLRPAWMLRAGLMLYDVLGGRTLLPATQVIDLTRDPAGRVLQPGIASLGFEYSDCTVDDTRLVVANARDAADHGAAIRPRVRVTAGARVAGAWELTLTDAGNGKSSFVRSRALVNAAGPWVGDVLARVLKRGARAEVRLVQGSHIVVPRLSPDPRAFMFQNPDGRIVFAIPFQDTYTLIGTTDRDYRGDPAAVTADDDEIGYLIAAVNRWLNVPVTRESVVWSFSGVRPLYDDGASEARSATRDYVLEVDGGPGEAPLLSVFGGKITTYRRLAEAVLDRLAPWLGPVAFRQWGWTAAAPLPGGNFPVDGLAALEQSLAAAHPYLDAATARRLVAAYGTSASSLLSGARCAADLGRHFGAGLYEAELRHMIRSEWALTADDVVWRRSKLGLRMSSSEVASLDAVMKSLAGSV